MRTLLICALVGIVFGLCMAAGVGVGVAGM